MDILGPPSLILRRLKFLITVGEMYKTLNIGEHLRNQFYK
jgi:hypothetical protein